MDIVETTAADRQNWPNNDANAVSTEEHDDDVKNDGNVLFV
jgi:hypothetical protein